MLQGFRQTKEYLPYALLALAATGLLYTLAGFMGTPAGKAAASDADSAYRAIDSGSTASGDVSVKLRPLKAEGGRLEVELSANTHSVELSHFDLMDIATLEYNGKTIKPISVPALRGHHSSGLLIFEIDNNIEDFTIRIEGIPKVQERIFSWGVKG